MIVPASNLRIVARGAPRKRNVPRTVAVVFLVAVLIGVCGWLGWVDGQIRYYAELDEARPADAIVVFGAAEYDGRPSPVLRARLDHALALYKQGMAPLMITLGGGGDEDSNHTEGSVGHDYLLAHGVPDSRIIAETQSNNTEESAKRLAVIAAANHLQRIVVVSDGTHLFRIHAICSRDGLDIYTSPRPPGKSISQSEANQRLWHEIMSYTAWRLHLH
jgi:uncharacterized SAM-binding protein YcdF (DUF218 family)